MWSPVTLSIPSDRVFNAAVNIPAADDNADLHAEFLHTLDLLGIFSDDIRVDPVFFLSP